MKRLLVFAVLFFSLTMSATGQNIIKKQLGIHSGYAVAVQPDYFYDYWSGGINFGVNYTYPLMNNLALQAGLQYNNFLFDDEDWANELDQFASATDPSQESAQFVVSGGLKHLTVADIKLLAGYPLLSDRLFPYLILGAGVIHNATDNLVISNFELEFTKETRLTYGLGAGIGWTLSKELNFFFEGYYHHALTEQENEQELSFDLNAPYQKEELSFVYLKLGFGYNL